MSNSNNFTKTVFEARYKAELEFFINLLPFAKNISKKYPHWTTNLQSIALRNPKKRCSVAINAKQASYEQDNTDDSLLCKSVHDLLDGLTGQLNIQEFLRIGLRRRLLFPLDLSGDELVKLIALKFETKDDALQAFWSNITDATYIWDAKDDKFEYHITLGPARKCKTVDMHIPALGTVKMPETARLMEFNWEQHAEKEAIHAQYEDLIEKYPNTALFMDIDCFKGSKNILGSEAKNIYDDLFAKLKDISGEFYEYILKKI